MSEGRDSSEYKLFESPEVVEEPSERKFFFEDFYSHQGVTEKTSMALVNKLNKVKTDPAGLVADCEAELKELDDLIEKEQKVYGRLFDIKESSSGQYLRRKKRERLEKFQSEYLLQEKKMDQLRRRREELRKLRNEYENGFFPQVEAFYATSSDAIEVLRKVDVKDQHVTTVAGNSDFWQIFAEGGAAEIDVFDISLPAIFYAELKLAGLENLNFKEYTKMFGKSVDDLQSRGADFFDWDIYKKIRDKLSSQAQIFFDGLLENKNILPGNRSFENGGYGGFIRLRHKDPFIGGVIRTAEDYERLKSKSKKTEYKFHLGDINDDYGSKDVVSSDAVYLSNINYDFNDALRLATGIILRGVKKVILSTSKASLTQARYSKVSEKKIVEGSNLGMLNEFVRATILGVGGDGFAAGGVMIEIAKK